MQRTWWGWSVRIAIAASIIAVLVQGLHAITSAPADRVLGQTTLTTRGRFALNASGMDSPAGVAVDLHSTTHHLYIADTGNSRVLAWNDEATFTARIATCEACPLFDAPKRSCQICGCAMDRKALWAEQKCPEGKWPAIPAEPAETC